MSMTEGYRDVVHVLRHSFRPSEELATSLAEFMEPGSERSRFLIHSTKRVAVDLVDHHASRLDNDIAAAQKDFERHRIQLALQPRVGVKELATGAVRVAFLAEEQARLDRMIAGIDYIPRALYEAPDKLPSRHYLYMDIAPSQLVSRGQTDIALMGLRQVMHDDRRRRFYTVQPVAIVGQDMRLEFPAAADDEPRAS